MAPSRDRLLHFGFKATVSDGKRAGWPGRNVCDSTGCWGRSYTISRTGGTRPKSQVFVGLRGLVARGGEERGLGSCVQLSSALPPQSASEHLHLVAPPHSPYPYRYTQTLWHFPASP